MDSDPDKQWFYDKISPTLIQAHRVKEVLFRGQSKFQSVEIIVTDSFGKCLVLDGKLQSAERDEFIYHEALVQPALVTHARPETVFIAGGGEGATLREVLSHKAVRRAVMVDIDAEVVALCQKYLPEHSKGAFRDMRAELCHADAREYLVQSGEKFDVIIIDLPEPIEEGPAYLLYTKEFYQLVLDRLNPGGIISVQSGSASWVDLLNFTSVHATLKSVFPIVRPYQANVPSFGVPWSFCFASATVDPLRLTPEEVDRRITAEGLTLRFYDGLTHRGIFSLPKHMRAELAKPGRIITDKEPLYIYHG